MSATFQDRRVWLGGGVGVGVLVLLAGWLVLVQPQLTATADTRTRTEDARLQNSTLAGKVSTLKAADRNLPALVSGLRRAREQLPITSGLSTFTDQLGSQAAAAKVTITSVAVGAVSVATATMPTVAAPGATSGTGAISESAPTTTTTSTSANPAGKLYQIQLTVITTGPLSGQRAFLTAVQSTGPRAALLSSVQLAPAEADTAAGAAPAGRTAVSSIDASGAMTTVMAVFVSPLTSADAKQLTAQLNAKRTR